MKRRDFFKKAFPAYVYRVGELFVDEAGLNEKEQKGYFDSFESAYPFLSEVSMEMLYQSAAQLGIDPTGLSKIELAKLVYENRGKVYHDG
ncbi:MAG: hypothetical protein KBS60_07285 [Phascolarctobacterium sp.]|nr:hypothetical protein [Candidatus Phascolarctobacterium caballi]MCQ2381433.1 hypothetical protein [Acidaminococcaceae bacterium]